MHYFAATITRNNNHAAAARAMEGMSQFFTENKIACTRTQLSEHVSVISCAPVWAASDHKSIDGTTHAGKSVLAGDIALYNPDTLRRWLGQRGLETRHLDDRALMCAYFNTKGVEAVRDIAGDFAFIFARPTAGEFYFCRDHLGLRPLYWTEAGGSFSISNSAGALHRVPGIKSDLNVKALARHMLAFTPGRGQTYHRDINACEPGKLYRAGFYNPISAHTYWKPRAQPENKFVDEDEAAGNVFEAVCKAINGRMEDGKQTGVSLSGGLDSSLIATLVCAQNPNLTIPAFTTISPQNDPEKRESEMEFATAAIAHCANAQHFTDDGNSLSFQTGLMHAGHWLRQPARKLHYHSEQSRHHLAARTGTEILLTGFGGDECVSTLGTSYMRECMANRNFGGAMDEAARRAEETGHTRAFILCWQTLSLLQPSWLRHARYMLGGTFNNRTVLPRSTARKFGTFQELQALGILPDPKGKNSLEEEIIGHISSGMYADRYNTDLYCLYDAGLELRAPLLDWRVLEATISLPSSHNMKPGENRALIRKCLKNYVPATIWQRRDNTQSNSDIFAKFNTEKSEIAALLEKANRHDLWRELVDVKKLRNVRTRTVTEKNGFYADLVYPSLLPLQIAGFLENEHSIRSVSTSQYAQYSYDKSDPLAHSDQAQDEAPVPAATEALRDIFYGT